MTEEYKKLVEKRNLLFALMQDEINDMATSIEMHNRRGKSQISFNGSVDEVKYSNSQYSKEELEKIIQAVFPYLAFIFDYNEQIKAIYQEAFKTSFQEWTKGNEEQGD